MLWFAQRALKKRTLGSLIGQCVSHRLIDEFRLFVHPITLGPGIPLLKRHSERTYLTFVKRG
jgi:dihydrofolate reductase